MDESMSPAAVGSPCGQPGPGRGSVWVRHLPRPGSQLPPQPQPCAAGRPHCASDRALAAPTAKQTCGGICWMPGDLSGVHMEAVTCQQS